jgi:hypothetical protein
MPRDGLAYPFHFILARKIPYGEHCRNAGSRTSLLDDTTDLGVRSKALTLRCPSLIRRLTTGQSTHQ